MTAAALLVTMMMMYQNNSLGHPGPPLEIQEVSRWSSAPSSNGVARIMRRYGLVGSGEGGGH